MERIPVCIHADDPILRSGVIDQLRQRPEVQVLEAVDSPSVVVALVVSDQVSNENLQVLRAGRRAGTKPVLIVTDVDEAAFISAVEAGIAGLLRRREATPERLVTVIRSAASGEGAVPPDLLGRLLEQVGRTQRREKSPRVSTFVGLVDREVEVLRLVAEGLDTAEIAAKLSYSQRTVKNVVHDITSRLHLKNRAHAVAYAMRQGLL